MNENFLKLEFPSMSENVGLMRTMVASFATQLEFTLAELEEIRVAVSEAVSNCVIHAYPNKIGMIEMKLAVKDGYLEIGIQDYGKGIADIEQAKQPTFSTEAERMGLGLVFMESFMDEMQLTSKLEKGTAIVMKKRPERGVRNVGLSCIS